MVKNLQIRNIDDVVYFKALEWKAKLRCDTWECLFEKIFSRDDVLDEIRRRESVSESKAGIMWARSIDAKLDARDREMLQNGEDVLV